MKKIYFSLALFIFILIFPTNIFAVTVTITSFPSDILSLDPFQVGVNVSGATNATNYLRVDLYKEGTSNYFGETYNGFDWYGGSDGKSYFPVQIQNSSASATLQAQIGNPGVNEYPGPGTYKLKIRRYTSSGSASSNDTQTPIDVQISYSTPSPTPTPTPSPTQASTSVPTQAPTSAPTPTSSPVKTPTPSPKITSNPQILGEETSTASGISGLRSKLSSPSPTSEALVDSEKKISIFPIFLIIGGLGCLGFAGFSLFRKVKSEYNNGNGENT